MSRQSIEIVTYGVDDPANAGHHRAAARKQAALLPGFGGWLALSDAGDRQAQADVVIWASREAAEAAAGIVATKADFAAFRAEVRPPVTIGHYQAPAGGLALMHDGSGIEIGRFRLRVGAGEAAMRAAHAAMVATHLSHQPGWLGQRLVRLQDGTFMDLAFAVTEAHARAICDSWIGNPACEAFLALIEATGMEFGSFVPPD